MLDCRDCKYCKKISLSIHRDAFCKFKDYWTRHDNATYCVMHTLKWYIRIRNFFWREK